MSFDDEPVVLSFVDEASKRAKDRCALGFHSGKKWATNGRPVSLRSDKRLFHRLTKFADDSSAEGLDALLSNSRVMAESRPADLIYFELDPTAKALSDWCAADSFWFGIRSSGYGWRQPEDNNDWLRGFIEGVLAVLKSRNTR